MARQQTQVIDPATSEKSHRGGAVLLLDVRTRKEFVEIHATGALNIPLHELTPDALNTHCEGVGEIHILCKAGARATKACRQLEANPCRIPDIRVVAGGTDAWAAASLPVTRGRSAMSLERQVRIAAGMLVAVGATLALTLNPQWAGLSLFVGCGLVFAGITDTCGMGILLSRMPWNR